MNDIDSVYRYLDSNGIPFSSKSSVLSVSHSPYTSDDDIDLLKLKAEESTGEVIRKGDYIFSKHNSKMRFS